MNQINMKELSCEYEVRRMDERDVDAIYQLSTGNPLFYEYCPPYVTKESIVEDMKALPPGRSREDKFYIGYFNGSELVAIMDLILHYPKEETAFIGLFMMNERYQGDGIGSKIIEESMIYLKKIGFEYVRLAFAKGNPQSEAFWSRNSFVKTGEEAENEGYTAILMERRL